MTPERFHDLVNHESGLLGVSETSPDMPRPPGPAGRRCPGGRGDRTVLLSGEEVDRMPSSPRSAGWTHWSSPGGSVRTAARGPPPDLHGLGFLGIALDDEQKRVDALLISTDQSGQGPGHPY